MSIKAIPQLEEKKTSSNQWEDDSLPQGGIDPVYHISLNIPVINEIFHCCDKDG